MRKTEVQMQEVFIKQIKILHQLLLPILVSNLVVSIALVYGLWNVVSQTSLILWMGMMVIVLAARTIYYFHYRKHINSQNTFRYTTYFIIGSALSGLLWGVGTAVLFPPEQLEYQLFILFVLIGMGAGAMSTLTAYLPAFFAYFPISILPVSITLLSIGDKIHISLGAMAIAYIVALSYFGTKINRTLKQSLTLRFQNIELVEQLRQQRNEAEHANTAKSKFLAAASHDLRQPLYALNLFTTALEETRKQADQSKILSRIKVSVNALNNLFNSLLDISQLDAGILKVKKTNFHLQPLLEKLANDFEPQAKEKGLEFYLQNCSYTVNSDPALLEQILINYISNAIRYTEKGSIKITCEEEADDLLCINVVDTGISIPATEQHAIFEEFYQLKNPERDRSKGLGLGLAIVQRTAKLLGHSIKVHSQLHTGSTFSILLKKINFDESKFTSSPEVIDETVHDDKFIIVIDDDSFVREGTETLLQLWNCQVITAACKEEAMNQLRKQNRQPDVIIADYRLRDNQTGIDAIRSIHAEYNKNIPALIVTGDIAVENLREVNDSGFHVLHKPIPPMKLRAFLSNMQTSQ